MCQYTIKRLIVILLAVIFVLPVSGASAGLGAPEPYLLKDINDATSKGSNPRWLMPAGNVTFLFMTNSLGESGLWKTDGTSAGTKLVKAGLQAGMSSDVDNWTADPRAFTIFKDYFYFPAKDAAGVVELWQSDGTESGTAKVLYNGLPISDPSSMTIVNNLMYFWGNTNVVFSTDGTPGGVQYVESGATFHGNLTYFADNLYYPFFDAYYNEYGFSGISINPPVPWPSKSLNVLNMQDFLVFGNYLFLTGREIGWIEPDDHGFEIWKMSESGEASLVSDLNISGDSNPSNFTVYDGFIYFSADDGQGRKLWRTDGSEIGTTLIQDLFPGPGGSVGYQFLGIVGATQGEAGKLIFATFTDSGNALWATNGTPGGTVGIGNVADRANLFGEVFGNYLYYTAEDASHGIEIWRTDGTPQGSQLFMDIRPGKIGSYPAALTRCGDRLCFAADDGEHGSELWSTNGSQTGTLMLADFNSAVPSSVPWGFTPAGGYLFFIASDRVSAANLWRTDGTSTGTVGLNSQIDVSFSDPNKPYDPGSLVAVGSRVFLVGVDATHGQELWVSDGTTTGTKLVKDIYPGTEGSTPIWLTAAGSKIYFLANNPQSEWELWVSDGSETGTHLIKDIIPNGSQSLHYGEVEALGENLIFTLYDFDSNSNKLWVSNGTEAGTVLLASLQQAGHLVEAGGVVYFAGQETVDGAQYLYMTDGTSDGTKVAAPLDPFYGTDIYAIYKGKDIYIVDGKYTNGFRLSGFRPNQFGIYAIHLLYGNYMESALPPTCIGFNGLLGCTIQTFYEYNSTAGEMFLWLSDGTFDGTVQITGNFSWPGQMLGNGSELVFTADTPMEGRQIWKTDGSVNGTVQISHFDQVMCGQHIDSQESIGLSFWNGQYFMALNDDGSNPAHGCELWVLGTRSPQIFLPLVTR